MKVKNWKKLKINSKWIIVFLITLLLSLIYANPIEMGISSKSRWISLMSSCKSFQAPLVLCVELSYQSLEYLDHAHIYLYSFIDD
jgi:cell division protein FtsW (lipid II flippase)